MDLQSMRLFHISLLILYSSKGICEISTNWLFEENNACGTEGICDCYNRDFVEHIVDCDNISINGIPRDLPVNTTKIFLSHNKLKVVPHKAFHDLIKLDKFSLDSNKLQTLPHNVFNGLSSLQDLSLSYNMINAIHNGTFHGLNCLEKLYLDYNKLTNIPSNTFEGLNNLGKLLLGMNEIEILHSDSFSGLSNLEMLDLNGNNLPILPETVFGDLHSLTELYLDDDSIIDLHKSYFIGLYLLTDLFEEMVALIINYILNRYLFQNRIGAITGNSFNSNVLEELHLYGNEIHKIEADSLFGIPNNTTIYLSCDSLSSVPINLEHGHMICVNPSHLPSVSMHGHPEVAERLIREGFECHVEHLVGICRPCGAGTYGGKGSEGCFECPPGGFYQDEIAQTEPSNVSMGIPCKLCNEGTYVKKGGGSSPKDCDVCPEGTNKSIHAGLRACYCKENYARMDRYGPCSLCLEEGLNCSQEFQALLPGYMWNWSIPDANLKDYMSFLENLMVDNDTTSMHTTYKGEVPRIFRCPRTESCPNNNNSITGNCATGYTGWLCTNCEPDYYSVLTACVPCPHLSILVIESCLFLVACALICLLLTRQIIRRAELERYSRSFIDIIIARIKILLGFYQNIYNPSRQESSIMDDLSSVNSDSINTSKTQLSSSTWLNFLSENYKREFWYWEIVELARKVTQTFLITLFGWEDRLTVILTTCISVLFLLLHARFRPMKSSYEQRLQELTYACDNILVIFLAT
ncbi:hypothetical protein BSL78_18240 [Apostichopus japonicus]|uniref:Tyrosine-protein kinase ephrin type A/B receptor-like domain-containing protein n=1 Tax=Stichopus japonicus TaxID=307972 RepID=A0A2G8KA82_STIJA|nr:hypothetical protein BSL78_18240 [Apostichopus japonicus]